MPDYKFSDLVADVYRLSGECIVINRRDGVTVYVGVVTIFKNERKVKEWYSAGDPDTAFLSLKECQAWLDEVAEAISTEIQKVDDLMLVYEHRHGS